MFPSLQSRCAMSTLLKNLRSRNSANNCMKWHFIVLCAIIFKANQLKNKYFSFHPSSEQGFNETIIMNMFAISNALIQIRPMNDSYELQEFRRAMARMNWTIEDVMFSIMQPCDRMLRKCLWLNKMIPCNKLFQVSKTTQGFCCSFNYKGTPKYLNFWFLSMESPSLFLFFSFNSFHIILCVYVQMAWACRILCFG